jgi:hypothetical protein
MNSYIIFPKYKESFNQWKIMKVLIPNDQDAVLAERFERKIIEKENYTILSFHRLPDRINYNDRSIAVYLLNGNHIEAFPYPPWNLFTGLINFTLCAILPFSPEIMSIFYRWNTPTIMKHPPNATILIFFNHLSDSISGLVVNNYPLLMRFHPIYGEYFIYFEAPFSYPSVIEFIFPISLILSTE